MQGLPFGGGMYGQFASDVMEDWPPAVQPTFVAPPIALSFTSSPQPLTLNATITEDDEL